MLKIVRTQIRKTLTQVMVLTDRVSVFFTIQLSQVKNHSLRIGYITLPRNLTKANVSMKMVRCYLKLKARTYVS